MLATAIATELNILDSRRLIVTADESVAINRQQNRDQQIWPQILSIFNNNQQSVMGFVLVY